MKIKYYRKRELQPMTPWTDESSMSGVSVSEADSDAGSPKTGDMIAFNPSNSEDRWLVAKKFFEDNYVVAG